MQTIQANAPTNRAVASAVLLLAHGSPDSLDDMAAYVEHIRGGRPTPSELVDEMRRRYALVGGRSPLVDITRAQARALEQQLQQEASTLGYRVYIGMRHWHPYIHETLAQMVDDGVKRVVALCLAPHYSRMSVGAYFAKLREAQEALGVELDVVQVESWHTHPRFLQAIAEKVRAARERFPSGQRDQVRVLFTAHSLPVAIVEQGDPYDSQVRETSQKVAEILRLPAESWQFCYQSAGATSAAWLGPQLKDVVEELANDGQRQLLVAPIGFVADHVEILYDIDIEARDIARRAGATLERTESMNVTPAFIAALADIVRQAVSVR